MRTNGSSGYNLEGSPEKTCLENGAWVPPTPIPCVKDKWNKLFKTINVADLLMGTNGSSLQCL